MNSLMSSKIFNALWGVVAILLWGPSCVYASSYNPFVANGGDRFNVYHFPNSIQGVDRQVVYDAARKEFSLTGSRGRTEQLEFRVFVPPGTIAFEMVMYTFSQPAVPNQSLVRFKAPPVGNIANVSSPNRVSVQPFEAFEKLFNGVELAFYNAVATSSVVLNPSQPNVTTEYQSNTGATRFAERSITFPTAPITTGGWMYVKVLQVPGQTMQGLEYGVQVSETCYRSWFAKNLFDASGNPLEDVEHTCGIPPRLDSISLSGSALTQASTNSVTIRPFPTDAILQQCSATDSMGIISKLVNIAGSTVYIDPTGSVLSSSQTVNIKCDSAASVPLTVNPSAQSLSGISLSASSLTQKTTNTVTIQSEPTTATLSQCTAVDSADVSSSLVQITGNIVSVNQSANNLKADETIRIRCNGFEVPLTIKPVAVLSGISLSKSSLWVGIDQQIEIKPNPLNAALPASGCTVINPGQPENPSVPRTTKFLDISNGVITLVKSSSTQLPLVNSIDEATVNFGIKCDVFEKQLVVARVVEGVDNAGNLSLKLPVLPEGEDSTKTNLRTFVAARLPSDAIFVKEDLWFFKTETEWVYDRIRLLNPDSVAYKTANSFSDLKSLDVNLGFTAKQLREYGIEVYLGYKVNGITFRNQGVVWK